MDLYVRESGEINAPALVFLHGGGVAGWIWDRQAEYFKDYHVIVPDLPGHGESAGVPFISINDAASKVLTAVMELVGNDRVTLIGDGLGAQMAVEIASKWPEKVDSAIISNALTEPLADGKYFFLKSYNIACGLGKLKTVSKLRARSLSLPDSLWDKYYQDSSRVTKENYIRAVEAGAGFAIPDFFSRSDVRMLILAGVKASERVKDSAFDLVHANRNCSGFLVSSAGQGLVPAEPDLFNEIVYNFINNIQLNRNNRLERIV